jgi:hypothetical protein
MYAAWLIEPIVQIYIFITQIIALTLIGGNRHGRARDFAVTFIRTAHFHNYPIPTAHFHN